MRFFATLALLGVVSYTNADFDLGWDGDRDLTGYVTRPEIKAPTFNVAIYDHEKVTPGYWFLAPYAEIQQKPNPPRYYSACQTGPAIYDHNGELVWSGACRHFNQNACDFRAWKINGTDYISAIMYKYKNDTVGHGIIMDNSYKVVKYILPPPELPAWNMHELNLVNNGTAALYFTMRPQYVNVTAVPDVPLTYGWIMNMGIREVDLFTGETLFDWWAHPEISLADSNVKVSQLAGPFPDGWNWFHGNSIVKNAEGDYLVNSRYTDAVYKISGKEGKIIWRLGGRSSDFKLDGFNFSRQHDARWVEGESDEKTEMITLLDNGSDGITSTSNTSSVLQISIDHDTKTATLVKRWTRPDNGRSDLRGNAQHLPNGNIFAAWSDNSFISEHTAEGDLVMAAEFTSERFVTYRAYKHNFTGAPTEPPVMKAFAYGVDAESATTVVYMSWNGATEIDRWDVHRSQTNELVGSVKRTGFETRFLSKGFEAEVYVQAVAKDGTVLGRTESYRVEPPREWGWEASGWEIVEEQEEEQEENVGPMGDFAVFDDGVWKVRDQVNGQWQVPIRTEL